MSSMAAAPKGDDAGHSRAVRSDDLLALLSAQVAGMVQSSLPAIVERWCEAAHALVRDPRRARIEAPTHEESGRLGFGVVKVQVDEEAPVVEHDGQVFFWALGGCLFGAGDCHGWAHTS